MFANRKGFDQIVRMHRLMWALLFAFALITLLANRALIHQNKNEIKDSVADISGLSQKHRS